MHFKILWVEEPVSPVSQSSSGGVTNNPPFPKMPGILLPVRVPPQAENTTNNIYHQIENASTEATVSLSRRFSDTVGK